MRVITGIARGMRLKTLEGTDVVRPTAEKIKEAMFSIVQFDLEDAVVLDLFALFRFALFQFEPFPFVHFPFQPFLFAFFLFVLFSFFPI